MQSCDVIVYFFFCTLCSSRTALSSTWCLTMLWTSGWPAHQQRSVSLSRSCITPAKPIGRGKQGVWERQGSRARWDAKGNQVSMLTKNLELVQVTPHQALRQKPCGPGGRVMSPPERQSSSTASPNSQEVVSHHY